ncbi:hypothetical protein BF93_01940 [Brachybacterium phenoliresistens]|uniref:Uncharacterized protein n=1 Tax=Brachybacterium phenoliresistens TaxID=396014 RepID=Z9JSA7_9MICO|nr:hypothetical protein [Brachybacterium phenoliresistens]EWS80637.1 hypothetical protein BF93_01940 [Brachybacterium phenoliresistens]
MHHRTRSTPARTTLPASPPITSRASSPGLLEREEIRRALLRSRPELSGRISTGPSGSLTIPRPGGACVEIGRMRRAGRVRWVVVASDGDRPSVLEVESAAHAAGLAIAALSAPRERPAPPESRARPMRRRR